MLDNKTIDLEELGKVIGGVKAEYDKKEKVITATIEASDLSGNPMNVLSQFLTKVKDLSGKSTTSNDSSKLVTFAMGHLSSLTVGARIKITLTGAKEGEDQIKSIAMA